jgi:hypothetical protein
MQRAGQIKQDNLIDESLHPISAFQIAEFHHVIGTLWEVRDDTCLTVAASVYKSMRSMKAKRREPFDQLRRSLCTGLPMFIVAFEINDKTYC